MEDRHGARAAITMYPMFDNAIRGALGRSVAGHQQAMGELLTAAGFHVVTVVDSTDDSLQWFRQVRDRVERDGPPPVTFAAFLGDAFGLMAANQVANLAERRIRTVMFTCTRPA